MKTVSTTSHSERGDINMDKFREELIKGIIEVSQETGLSVNQCIYEAKKMLRQQMKEHYKQQLENQMFKGW